MFLSKQSPCSDWRTMLRWCWCLGKQGSPPSLPQPDWGGGKWLRHVDLILPFLPLHLTLVIPIIKITCRPYDVTVTYLLSVVFDQTVTVDFLTLSHTWIMHPSVSQGRFRQDRFVWRRTLQSPFCCHMFRYTPKVHLPNSRPVGHIRPAAAF